jgi:hypothetical protein
LQIQPLHHLIHQAQVLNQQVLDMNHYRHLHLRNIDLFLKLLIAVRNHLLLLHYHQVLQVLLTPIILLYQPHHHHLIGYWGESRR